MKWVNISCPSCGSWFSVQVDDPDSIKGGRCERSQGHKLVVSVKEPAK